ncbi:hypothetical protein ABZS83_30130 [Streptomyces sp. NPDC005426]|uniref:hypothetical protein n=1 Tax=Streptomyces sp. NPDC005426 TaxID=3155344 RepID=UPI0033BE0ECA
MLSSIPKKDTENSSIARFIRLNCRSRNSDRSVTGRAAVAERHSSSGVSTTAPVSAAMTTAELQPRVGPSMTP